jgi:MFS family permease
VSVSLPPPSRRARLLASLRPGLPRAVQTLQVGGVLNALGNGLVTPFLLIYLHQVRGIGLGLAGLIVGTTALVSIVVTPVAGALADHIGPRTTLFVALGALSLGFAGYALVDVAAEGFAAAAVAGIGNGLFWPSQSALIASLTTREERGAAFAMQRVTMNLGIGVGAMLGGFIADTAHPGTFQLLFAGDALTFVLYAGMLTRVPAPPRLTMPHHGPPGTYRDVLRNRIFLGVLGINVVLVTAGIAQLEVLPAFVTAHAGMSESGVGWIFFVNTVVVVALQMPLARVMAGHRRMPSLAAVAVLWAASWALVPVVADGFSGAQATVLLAAVLALFAVGECFHGVVQAPLVTDLADPRLIGRYMALSALSWNLAFSAGPALGAAVLGQAPNVVWIGAAAILLLGGVAAMALEPSLPSAVRRSPKARPVMVET